jgi:iron complex outermembrane receptor protein
MLQSVIWPEVELAQTGLFGEWLLPVGADDTLRLGLRYDRIDASAGKAGLEAMGGMSPNKLYRMYYGMEGADSSENNWGGVLRYERPLDQTTRIFAGFSRSLRTADATERYFASNSSAPGGRWVGNPGLAPEQHHQLEAGLSQRGGQWDSLFTVFYNQVGDYILRDRAHGQAGILLSDNATIYRNVDARLMGLEWEGGWRWQDHWSARLGLAYVHATNTSDDRPIAQTPPLEGSLSLDYFHAKGLVGAKLRFAARQTRVDDNMLTGSGLDARETPGFGALDLYGTWQASKMLEARLGVNNVFDTTYAYHVNRANADPFTPEAIQVNEPGRSVWLKLTARF